MNRKALSPKILCLGLDAMDPRMAKKYVEQGIMPNLKTLIDRGSCREDLVLLGSMPTVTPPQWTTLACGCHPQTHGITAFNRQAEDDILCNCTLNFDSRGCQAEQLWNVFAEAGKKTLVWHWPGSAWPPSSDSPNLHVVDGSSPGNVNMSTAQFDGEYLLVASEQTEFATYRHYGATNSEVPCVVTGLDPNLDEEGATIKSTGAGVSSMNNNVGKSFSTMVMTRYEQQGAYVYLPTDIQLSPLKPADDKWANAPQGAKEFILLLSGGAIRRPGLLLQNEDGKYDSVALFKSKKNTEPMVTFTIGEYVRDIVDEGLRNDNKIACTRDMKLLEIAEDGSMLKMWISPSMDISMNAFWHPKSLFDEIVANVGYPPPTSNLGGDYVLMHDCMNACWEHAADWQSASLNHLIKEMDYDVIFSHFHAPDLQKHMFIRFMHTGSKNVTVEQQELLMRGVYEQIDRYIGEFIHLLDKQWTILIVSDHAQVCPTYGNRGLGDTGTNIELMEQLGFTVMKRDAEGNKLREIDWSKTKAVANREMHIYINLKGRNPEGIVEPEDQFQVEEEIMTALYGHKDEVTGQRIIAFALRRQDAKLVGLGGEYPQCGDIIYCMAQGYEHDHDDSLPTSHGECDTYAGPIFVAAGTGIKEGFKTTRDIKQIDVAPTMAILGGVRFPADCEGAPVYQIFTEEI